MLLAKARIPASCALTSSAGSRHGAGRARARGEACGGVRLHRDSGVPAAGGSRGGCKRSGIALTICGAGTRAVSGSCADGPHQNARRSPPYKAGTERPVVPADPGKDSGKYRSAPRNHKIPRGAPVPRPLILFQTGKPGGEGMKPQETRLLTAARTTAISAGQKHPCITLPFRY